MARRAALCARAQPGEVLELDAGGARGEVVLKNAKGKKRVHEASTAMGIEEDSGFGTPGVVKPTSNPTASEPNGVLGDVRITKPGQSV